MASQHDGEVIALATVGDIRYDAISRDSAAGGVVGHLKGMIWGIEDHLGVYLDTYSPFDIE
jgi:hypothetical protein